MVPYWKRVCRKPQHSNSRDQMCSHLPWEFFEGLRTDPKLSIRLCLMPFRFRRSARLGPLRFNFS